MEDKRKAAFTAIIIAISGIVLALATLPAGLPVVRAIASGTALNIKPVMRILTSGDPLNAWAAYLGKALTNVEALPFAMLWLLACIAVVAAFAVYGALKSPKRGVEGGVLGDARLVTSPREIRKKNDFWDGRGIPDSAGLVIGNSPKGYVYDSSVPHWAVIGKTGSGKSWLMCLQTLHLCMARGWNLIVTGKNELLELTGDKAKELGYNRVILDLKGYPGASKYNPLELVVEHAENGDVAEAQRVARQLAADLVPSPGGESEFFYNGARDILAACALVVAMADIPRDQKNMASVAKMVALGTSGDDAKDPAAPIKAYLKSSEVGTGHPAYQIAGDLISDGGVTQGGKNIVSTLRQALSIFADEDVARITSRSDVSITDIVKEKTVVYMHLLEEGDPYLAIFTCFFNQYWRVAQKLAADNGGRLPHETAIIGDEWGNMPKVNALPEIATLGRSYRLHLYCFTQDLKQWNKYNRPGDQNAGRDKILGCMGGKVALSLANPDDFAYFTKLAGKRTIRTQSTGTSSQGSAGGARTGASESYTEHAEDLIHEWEWANRIPVRDGLIAIKGGENAKPGREGVYQLPVVYASDTPAAAFFGLGAEGECDAKRIESRERMEAERPAEPDMGSIVWCPDFAKYLGSPDSGDAIEADEFSAWD